ESQHAPLDVRHQREEAQQGLEEHQHLDGADGDLLLEGGQAHVAAAGWTAPALLLASSNVFATRRQQPFSRTWYSYSSRNRVRVDRGGVAAASPKAQTVLPMMESQTVERISRSRGVPWPSSILSSRRSSQPVPSRQGEHLPHDSCL